MWTVQKAASKQTVLAQALVPDPLIRAVPHKLDRGDLKRQGAASAIHLQWQLILSCL